MGCGLQTGEASSWWYILDVEWGVSFGTKTKGLKLACKWCTIGVGTYRWAAGKLKGRLEGMVQGGLMGQEGRERDALSIDYHTEHPCALVGLRLCRRTKPWFSTSFPRGRALETEDGGHPLPFPPTHPLPLFLPPSVSISRSLSLAGNVAAAMHQRQLQNNARAQPGIWRAFIF